MWWDGISKPFDQQQLKVTATTKVSKDDEQLVGVQVAKSSLEIILMIHLLWIYFVPYSPAIPLLDIYTREVEMHVYKNKRKGT